MSILSQLSKIAVINWALGSLSVLLNFPPLIGYIATGFLVGPWVAEYIRNPTALYILHEAGDIGLLILMFFTGMEIDIKKFLQKDQVQISIRSVILQLLLSICIVLMASIFIHFIYYACYIKLAYYEYISCLMHCLHNRTYIQIFALITSLLFLNSTAIPIQLLESNHEKNTKLGKSLISVLIMQDIFLIPVIICLKSFASIQNPLIVLVKMSAAFIAIYLIKYIINYKEQIMRAIKKYTWFIEWEMSNVIMLNQSLLPISLISFALGSAYLFEIIGLSDVYGAFIAGLIVGNITSGSRTVHSFAPVVDIMIIPVFMNIGTMLNLYDLKQDWKLIFTISLLVLTSKFLYNYFILNLSNRNYYKPNTVFKIQSALLLSQVSEFSFFIIELVSANLSSQYIHLVSIIKSVIMVCLTLGSILIVLLKQYISQYQDNDIDTEEEALE